MMLRVVLVEPEYEINLGYIARVMTNFGFDELVIVNPRAEIGRKARMFAKHGYGVLQGAKLVQKVQDAVGNCDLIVGTSGKVYSWRDAIRNPLSAKMFAKKISKYDARIALLVGREGTGLSRREINMCHIIVSVPTSEKYPILNVSHALGIILYEIAQMRRGKMLRLRELAKVREREELFRTFDRIVGKHSYGLRDADKIKIVLRRIIGRSMPTKLEIKAMLGILKRIEREG